MRKSLILVKHSLPDVLAHLPANHWKLSEEGRMRVQWLAEKIRPFEPEAIISSNEPKAKETAEILARLLGLELEVAEDLHEHDRVDTPLLDPETFQTSVRNFFQQPDQLVFGRETANQAHTRFERAIHAILHNHPEKTVLIVSHGTVISLFVSRRTGTTDWQLWSELGLPSFVVLDREASRLIARETHI
jgi:broad specificity phosphatase PhoE